MIFEDGPVIPGGFPVTIPSEESSADSAVFGISYHSHSGSGDAQAGSGPEGTGTIGTYGGADTEEVPGGTAEALNEAVPSTGEAEDPGPPPPQPVIASVPSEKDARNKARRAMSGVGQEWGPKGTFMAIFPGLVEPLRAAAFGQLHHQVTARRYSTDSPVPGTACERPSLPRICIDSSGPNAALDAKSLACL
ncbi:nitrogenase [Burkholderiales bacterium GJ-E10]|nr:nitrogenase [Burkholderiales bacterium GJ-E10]